MSGARRIIENLGRATARRLVERLEAGDDYTEIGEWLGVSKQRVGQLSKALGVRVVQWAPHPEIAAIAAGGGS